MTVPTDASKEQRCPWANDLILRPYHDREWGVPVHDDRSHFELICLEGAQAGLSWKTVLRKRDGYRRAFSQFDPNAVSRIRAATIDRLMADAAVIRHRGKLESVVSNAKAFLALQTSVRSFDDYVWEFVDGKPIVHRFANASKIPTTSPQAVALSKDLKARGFRFVGPTICYSYLQAAGLVNDHLMSCPRWRALG